MTDQPSLLRRLMPAWLPALSYMLLIWFLSSRPVTVSLDQVPFKDKGVHVMEYATLAVLSARAITLTWPRLTLLRGMFYAAVLSAAWGYSDELHQAFVPTRDSSAFDFMADVIGAVVGVSAFALLSRLRRLLAGSQARG